MIVNGREIIRDDREALRLLANDKTIGFDTETTGLSPWVHHIATIQLFGEESGTAALLQYPNGCIPDEVRDFFVDPDRLFIGHNVVSFDIPMLDTAGVDWRKCKWYDTLVGEEVCITTTRKDIRKDLGSTLKRRLNVSVDKSISHGHWHEQLTEAQISYAMNDVMYLPALMRAQIDKALETNQQDALALEQSIVPYVAGMTVRGLPCTPTKMEEFINQQEAEAEMYYEEMIQKFGDINFNSPVQIRRAVLDRYSLVWKSTAKSYLAGLALDDIRSAPLANLLLKYRIPTQRLKMYNYEFIENYIIGDLVHSMFWQCGAATGRFTSSNPNLQQIPRDGRWVFGNRPGYKVVAVDYSQIEIRVAAYLSNDKELQYALDSEDVHQATAAAIFQIPFDKVTKEQRRQAKAANFLLIFVGGSAQLYNNSREDGSPMSMVEAERVYAAFFNRFTGLKSMRDRAIAMARERRVNQIIMPSGLKRVLIGADNRPTVIMNSMIQGFAAAGLKQGIRVAGEAGLMDYVGAQVHDELVGWVEEKYAEDFGHALSDAMVKGMKLYLPTTVIAEAKIGDTW